MWHWQQIPVTESISFPFLFCALSKSVFFFVFASAATAWSLEDISPPTEAVLFNFKKEHDLSHWTPYSDKPHGGKSSLT